MGWQEDMYGKKVYVSNKTKAAAQKRKNKTEQRKQATYDATFNKQVSDFASKHGLQNSEKLKNAVNVAMTNRKRETDYKQSIAEHRTKFAQSTLKTGNAPYRKADDDDRDSFHKMRKEMGYKEHKYDVDGPVTKAKYESLAAEYEQRQKDGSLQFMKDIKDGYTGSHKRPNKFDAKIDSGLQAVGKFIDKTKKYTSKANDYIEDKKLDKVKDAAYTLSGLRGKVDAMKSAVKGADKVDQYGGASSTRNVLSDITDGKNQSLKDYAKAIKEGFTGKRRATGEEIAHNVGIDSKYGAKATGFGIEMLADPSNLLGVGAYKIGAKALKSAKGLGKAAKTEQLLLPAPKTKQEKLRRTIEYSMGAKFKSTDAKMNKPKTTYKQPLEQLRLPAPKQEDMLRIEKENFARKNEHEIKAIKEIREMEHRKQMEQEIEFEGHQKMADEYQKIRKSLANGKFNIPAANHSDFVKRLPKGSYSAKGKGMGDDIYKVADNLGMDVDDLVDYYSRAYESHKIVKGGKGKVVTQKLSGNPDTVFDDLFNEHLKTKELPKEQQQKIVDSVKGTASDDEVMDLVKTRIAQDKQIPVEQVDLSKEKYLDEKVNSARSAIELTEIRKQIADKEKSPVNPRETVKQFDDEIRNLQKTAMSLDQKSPEFKKLMEVNQKLIKGRREFTDKVKLANQTSLKNDFKKIDDDTYLDTKTNIHYTKQEANDFLSSTGHNETREPTGGYKVGEVVQYASKNGTGQKLGSNSGIITQFTTLPNGQIQAHVQAPNSSYGSNGLWVTLDDIETKLDKSEMAKMLNEVNQNVSDPKFYPKHMTSNTSQQGNLHNMVAYDKEGNRQSILDKANRKFQAFKAKEDAPNPSNRYQAKGYHNEPSNMITRYIHEKGYFDLTPEQASEKALKDHQKMYDDLFGETDKRGVRYSNPKMFAKLVNWQVRNPDHYLEQLKPISKQKPVKDFNGFKEGEEVNFYISSNTDNPVRQKVKIDEFYTDPKDNERMVGIKFPSGDKWKVNLSEVFKIEESKPREIKSKFDDKGERFKDSRVNNAAFELKEKLTKEQFSQYVAEGKSLKNSKELAELDKRWLKIANEPKKPDGMSDEDWAHLQSELSSDEISAGLENMNRRKRPKFQNSVQEDQLKFEHGKVKQPNNDKAETSVVDAYAPKVDGQQSADFKSGKVDMTESASSRMAEVRLAAFRSIKDIKPLQGNALSLPELIDKLPNIEKARLHKTLDTGKEGNVNMMVRETVNLSKVTSKKGLGIKKGSKESKLVQQYGEGTVSLKKLQEQRPNDWKKIVQANNFFKNKYKEYIAELNKSRAKIGLAPLQERPDFYQHMQDLDGMDSVKNTTFGSNSTDIKNDPHLDGRSSWVKPKGFKDAAKQKIIKGKMLYKEDAVGNFLGYLKGASHAIHLEPVIHDLEIVTKAIRKATEGTKKADRLVKALQGHINDLSGRTNEADKSFHNLADSKRAVSIIHKTNSRVQANMIKGNIGSLVGQLGGVPVNIAKANPVNSAKGAARTVGDLAKRIGGGGKDLPIAQSKFFKERYVHQNFEKFDTKWYQQPGKLATWALDTVDKGVGHFTWNSFYEKGLKAKVADPVKYADQQTRHVMAGRGVGEVPLFHKSLPGKVLAPFTLEVGNQWKVLGGIAKNPKERANLLTYIIAAYGINKASEEVRGSGITYDPLDAVLDGYTRTEGKVIRKVAGSLGSLLGETIGSIPGGNVLIGTVDDYSVPFTNEEVKYKDIFGNRNPNRFGGDIVGTKGFQDPLYYALPFGASQVRKFVKGQKAISEGGIYSKSGKMRYPIESDSALKRAQLRAFGPYSSSESREYYKSAKPEPVLGEKDTERIKNAVNKMEEYKKVLKRRQENREKQK